MIASEVPSGRLKFSLSLILLSLPALILPIAHAADDAAATQTEAQVPGDLQIARWDLLLNDNGLESIDSIDHQIIHTPSVIYSAAMFNADALRAAVNAAIAVGGVEGGSQPMGHTQNQGGGVYYMQRFHFNYDFDGHSHLGIENGPWGQETYDSVQPSQTNLKLDYVFMKCTLIEVLPDQRKLQAPFDKNASLSYNGQLKAGEALVFSANIKGKTGTSYRHMIIWEAFKAEPRYQPLFQAVYDYERWCRLGPKWIRNAADVAAVWATQAKHLPSEVTPKWELTLDDGKKIRLTAITRADKWLYCWWDADGQPLAINDPVTLVKHYENAPSWFRADVSGPPDEWKIEKPIGKPGYAQGNETGPYHASISGNVVSGYATVGVPAGPWKKLGQIQTGGTIEVGASTYTLSPVQASANDQIQVLLLENGGDSISGDVVTLSAVGQDGNEVDADYLPKIISRNTGMPFLHFQDMA